MNPGFRQQAGVRGNDPRHQRDQRQRPLPKRNCEIAKHRPSNVHPGHQVKDPTPASMNMLRFTENFLLVNLKTKRRYSYFRIAQCATASPSATIASGR